MDAILLKERIEQMGEKKPKRFLFVATVQSHICQFHKAIIKNLREQGYEVDVAARNNLAEKNGLKLDFADEVFNLPFSRSPFALSNIGVYRQLRKIIRNGDYDVVHCNTPVGGVLTRFCTRKLRKKGVKIVYTAHGFHFYKGAPLKNWLIYYPIEKICARWTDVLITINKEDYKFAQRKLRAKEICYVPGVGFNKKRFEECDVSKEAKRKELGTPQDAFLLVSVGELLRNKNHEVVLRAMAQIDDPRIYYVIAGNGKLRDYLLNLARELGVEDRVKLLGYRLDVHEIYRAGDVFVFPSIREGLPLAPLEATASGLFLVCADNRGTREYAENEKNALVCPWNDVDAFKNAILRVMTDKKLKENAKVTNVPILARFDVENVVVELNKIYQRVAD